MQSTRPLQNKTNQIKGDDPECPVIPKWKVPFYSPTFHTGSRSSHYISKSSTRSSRLRPALSLLQTNTFPPSNNIKYPAVPKSAPITPYRTPIRIPRATALNNKANKMNKRLVGRPLKSNNIHSHRSHSGHSKESYIPHRQYPRSVPCTPVDQENIPRNISNVIQSPVPNPCATPLPQMTRTRGGSAKIDRIKRRHFTAHQPVIEMQERAPSRSQETTHLRTRSLQNTANSPKSQLRAITKPILTQTPPPIICKSVVIFDWDDTLLPSFDLQQLGLRPKSKGSPLQNTPLTAEQKERVCVGLKKLEQTVQQLLFTALQYVGCGHVVIVTNAERGWVELSCSTFLPNVMKILRNCKVISARSTFENQYPSSTIEWKRRAIKLVLDELLDTDIDISRVSMFKGKCTSSASQSDSHGDSQSDSQRDFQRDSQRDSQCDSEMKEIETDTDIQCESQDLNDSGFSMECKEMESLESPGMVNEKTVIDILQVLSFGDSLVERQAVFDVTKCINLTRNRVKTVKTKSVKLTATPSIHWLLDELSTIQRSFVQILQHPQDLDYQVFLQQKEPSSEHERQ